MNKKKMRLVGDQRGVVAITVTFFFIIILTLVVLAFSQAARRQQRQTIDNQLTKQAFYAAESGINDTLKGLESGTLTGVRDTDCDTAGSNLSSDGVISYSCVMWDKELENIDINPISTISGRLVPLHTTSSLSSVTIKWHDSDGGSTFSGCDDNPSPPSVFPVSLGTQCDAGMLRAFFIAAPGTFTRDPLIDNTYTVFLRPRTGVPGTASFTPYSSGSTTQGSVVSANCIVGGVCSATISFSPAINPANTNLFVQLRSIYKDNAVSITGLNGAVAAKFDTAQVKIDATGKANDVLRRLQVRVPLGGRYSLPDYAVEAMNGICKQLDVYPNQTNDPYQNCFPGSGPTDGIN